MSSGRTEEMFYGDVNRENYRPFQGEVKKTDCLKALQTEKRARKARVSGPVLVGYICRYRAARAADKPAHAEHLKEDLEFLRNRRPVSVSV